MRRDAAFVEDIFEACNEIQRLCAEKTAEDCESDKAIRAALLHHLTVIGEAAARLSTELRESYPELSWHRIISQRNRIVHAYFGLDWNLIWYSITHGVPELRVWAEAALPDEST